MKEAELSANVIVNKNNELRKINHYKQPNSSLERGKASNVKTCLDIEKTISVRDTLSKCSQNRGYHREIGGFCENTSQVIMFDDAKYLGNPS